MYPLRFSPILKQTIWGGEKIVPFKHLSDEIHRVGESWEVSGVPGNESIIANGEYKGMTLTELLKLYRENLVGKANYIRFGDKFPLLVKFIDANQDLSIQVHPSDELASERHHSLGKTEMWYVMGAEKDAKLCSGFSRQITPAEYKERVCASTIMEVMQKYKIREGDVFFIPAGRVHSIGAGAFIAEIQETSDITYRIFDFDRRDAEGHKRELHTDLALDAIDYTIQDDYRTHYEQKKDEAVGLVSCPYFTASIYDLTAFHTSDYSKLDSFVILICLKGSCKITDNENNTIELHAGETILLSALTQHISITPLYGVKLLEAYI